MFKTKICEILNIQYPIILGGMLWIGKSDLVAAVSEAGGLGLMGAGGMTIEEIDSECSNVKAKTKKPFGVNIPLVRPDSDEMINAAIKNGASVIATSSGSPKKYTKMIQEQGCRVIHVVANVTFAKKSARHTPNSEPILNYVNLAPKSFWIKRKIACIKVHHI